MTRDSGRISLASNAADPAFTGNAEMFPLLKLRGATTVMTIFPMRFSLKVSSVSFWPS